MELIEEFYIGFEKLYYKQHYLRLRLGTRVLARQLLTSTTRILAKLNSLFFGVNPDLMQD